MPIHIRAEEGDYAEACLLPGDPVRAEYIATTYLEGATRRNEERGLLGFTGEFLQATGMGGPSAGIVVEELIKLGVRRLVRVGTCRGPQRELRLGDLIVATTAVPADGASRHYAGHEPHAPAADWELTHAAVHAAETLGQRVRVGAVASSDTFYDPDAGRHQRWSTRGVLAVEMEASTLFTVASLRAAVDRMTRVALATLTMGG